MNTTLDLEAIYLKTVDAVLHYSKCISQMHTVAMVQGLIVLTGAIYTLKIDEIFTCYS